MDFDLTIDQQSLIDGLRATLAPFDDAYWLERDRTATFPDAFARAMAEGGHDLEEQISSPHLAVRNGNDAGAVLRFNTDSSEWSIGTDAEHDLVLSDEGVSAFHAKIVREGDRWKLIDQMSANGTFIDDQKTTVGYLASGDCIRFGPVDCIVTLPEARRETKPVAVANKSKNRTLLIAGAAAIATVIVLVVLSRFL